MEEDYSRQIELGMIQDDASFMVGLMFAARGLAGKNNIPYLFGSTVFSSLIMHETYTYFSKRKPEMAAKLKNTYSDEIKQSRQRIKLFDDDKLNIEEIGKMLLETITSAHQKELTKSHRIKLPRWAWKDIGLYFDANNSIAVGSTHLVSFSLGLDVVKFFDPSTAKGLGEVQGRYFITIAKNHIMLVRLPQLDILAHDVQSHNVYTTKKYGSSLKSINAGLSIIDMNLNFLALCLPKGKQHPPIFKWKFLTVYHAISSLRKLLDSEYAKTINRDTLLKIEAVVESDFSVNIIRSHGALILRNTLTHYGLDSRIDYSKLNLNSRKFYGVVEASLPNIEYEELSDKLDEFISNQLLNLFEAW